MRYLNPEVHKQVYDDRGKKTATTKLDAPYTRFTIRGRASIIPVSSEVKGIEIQPLNMHLHDLMPPEASTATVATLSAAELVQKLPRHNDQNDKAQQMVGQKHLQTGRALTQSKRMEGKGSKLAREQRGGKAMMMHQNKRDAGKTNDDSTLTIRFITPEQEPDRKVSLQAEAQNPSPATVRRHFCASASDLDQNLKPDSGSNIRKEGGGKTLDDADIGTDDNTFRITKHRTWNPYERVERIQREGEITSRDQARGLHAQYHLVLNKQP